MLIEARENVSLDIYRQTLQSVARLLKAHLISRDMCEEGLEDIEAIALRFAELPSIPREREKVLSLEFSTEMVREAIEAIKDRGDKTQIVDEMDALPLYGPIRYKCPKPWCGSFSVGFATRQQRKDHVNEHDRPFRCTTEGCYHVDIGFPTESGLKQHIKRHHTQPEMTLFPKPRKAGKGKGDIFTAVKEGDLDTVMNLVESGKNVKKMKRTAEGETTLLMLAVEHGHLDVCKYLLDNGADVNFPAVPEVESILHKAIRRDDVEVIDLLLKQDEIALGVTVQSLPAPDWAAAKCHSLSLFRVTKPRHSDKRITLGHEPQQDQIRNAHVLSPKTSMCISQSFIDTLSKTSDNMLRLLLPLDWPDESSRTGSWCTLLHVACRRGDIRLARRLVFLDSESDVHDHAGRTPLALAADTGSIDLVSTLLESGRVKLTSLTIFGMPGQSVLVTCAKYNHRITEKLLEADPSLATQSDPDGKTLLCHALSAGNKELIQYLIVHTDVDVDTLLQSHPPYERLSRYIGPERLLEADPSLVNQSDPDSIALLHHALHAGNKELFRYLIIHTDVDVNTLLQSHPSYKRLSRYINAERLLEADPSLITQSDLDATTLLRHALYAGNNELIRYLIIHTDVDVNTLLQSHPSYKRLSRSTGLKSITPLRMSLELGSDVGDRHASPEATNVLEWVSAFGDRHKSPKVEDESEWKAESFESISEALLASNRVDLSGLECREELQYLALAAKLRSKSLTWSLLEKGLLTSWEGPLRNQENIAELMFVLKEDINSLVVAASTKSLSHTLNMLVGTQTLKRGDGFLAMLRSDFRLAKEIFMGGSITADRNTPEENRLAFEEAVRRNEHDLVHEMIRRGFDGNIALLLAAETGSVNLQDIEKG
jgi:ankyrin repeat protein